jgi:hypothetical protein
MKFNSFQLLKPAQNALDARTQGWQEAELTHGVSDADCHPAVDNADEVFSAGYVT